MDNFESFLRKHNLRVTEPRRRVFEVLLRSTSPLSHNEIYKYVEDIDRASVYRTINTFIKTGAVKVVYIGWKKLYELTDIFSPHHHHLRCVKCGNISHISDASFEKSIEKIARDKGYKLISHHFEIDGVCPNCLRSVE